jgi:hypothetical protein
MKTFSIVIIALVLAAIFATDAQADRRNYVWTYQYMTMPEGMTELEFYQTTKVKEIDDWEFRMEVETGLTDRWDFSIYQIFKQTEGESFKWDAVQARTRYRLGEQGQYFFDPLLYFEYNRKIDMKKPNKLEAKLILARQMEAVNLAINPIYEYFFAPGTEHEVGLDIGLSYEVNPRFIFGVESTSRQVLEDDADFKSYFGPTVSVASGGWWYAAGVAFGITEESDDARVRFIMGIEL